jgi:hypothetical protein
MSDHFYPEAATITASGAREMIADAVTAERARCTAIIRATPYENHEHTVRGFRHKLIDLIEAEPA